MSREHVEHTSNPHKAAQNMLTKNGRHTLVPERWLDAGPPGGSYADPCYKKGVNRNANAKSGVQGHVKETGQSFTLRDDYDFANPSNSGKGYHVNAQLGKETYAFCGNNSKMEYQQRVQMNGERVLYDGDQKAGDWYLRRR